MYPKRGYTANLYRAVSGAINTANETKNQLKSIRRACSSPGR